MSTIEQAYGLPFFETEHHQIENCSSGPMVIPGTELVESFPPPNHFLYLASVSFPLFFRKIRT